MKKPCTGTLYKIGKKYYCVGEKLSKKGYNYTSKKLRKNKKSKKTRKHRK